MKIRILIATALILITAGIAAAQQPSTRIAVINSNAFFADKTGITKLLNAQKSLNGEFTATQTELDTMNKRLQTLAGELEAIRKQSNPDAKVFQTKSAEGEQLQRNLKYKSEDAKERYARREGEVLGPVQNAIGTGLQEYAKTKGYALIFDAAKDQNGILVAMGDQTIDVTKDFIAFYNAKP